jgi:hypothetical protein
LALAAGEKTSSPAVMSARLTNWFSDTAAPSRVRPPAAGRELIFTAARPWPSIASLKPKSAAAKT